MPSLYMLIGPQASGKSTWCRLFDMGLPTIASDNYFQMDENGRRYFMQEGERKLAFLNMNSTVLAKAWQSVWRAYGEMLREGKSFILEGTYPTIISRSHAIHVAKSFGYDVICIYFNASLEKCLEWNRNRPDPVTDKVLARTYASMEAPHPDEGWDQIHRIADVYQLAEDLDQPIE